MLVFTIPLDRWLGFQEISTVESRLVLWLLAAAILIQLTEGISHAGFRANGDYALHRVINYLTLLVQFIGIWLAAAAGLGPLGAAAAFLIVRAVVTPCVAYLLARRHSWLRFGISNARASQFKTLFRPALANTGFPLAQALSTQGMVLVVGATLGPLAVVTFSTLRTLTRISLQLVLAVSHAAEPEMAALHGSGDRAVLRSLYQHTLRASLWLAVGSALFLAVTGSWILDVWTQGAVKMDVVLFSWLLLTSVASVLWYGALTTLKAANRHLRASLLYTVTAGSTVALSAMLLSTTGILAAAGLSLLLSDCVLVVYGLRAAAQLCGSTALGGLRAALNPAPLLKLASAKGHAH
jgi:O-antigen/teichoic acid export membrane protein